MELIEPALFYTGIVAELYGPLRASGAPNADPYARFIERSGQPALELGCGDGDPLLELRSRGLDVEGLDSSPDMLARCRSAALELGLEVVVHNQSMEAMDLPRRYRSIFIAGPTFNLLPDDDTATRALDRIRVHLEPGGSVLIPLFVPSPTPREAIGRTRLHTPSPGTTMALTPVEEHRDEEARCQTTVLRYELTNPSGSTVEERPWLLHWYTQQGFRELTAAAGLEVKAVLKPEGGVAGADDDSFVFVLAHARSADASDEVQQGGSL